MIHFETPWYLFFLLGLVLFIAIFIIAFRQNEQMRQLFGGNAVLARLAPEFDSSKGVLKFVLSALAFALMVLGVANLQKASKTEMVKRKGVDVYIAMDISKSMWAQDLQPNRMERARQFATKLVDGVRGDRVGLVFFAGQAFLQMPLTTDYSAAQLFTRTANPGLEITQGTVFGEVVSLVSKLDDKQKKKKQRALVFVTDGENHEDDAIEKVQDAKKEGITTFIVGVGTAEGAPIPLMGKSKNHYQEDANGNVVQSKMDADLLKKVAKAGGGQFYNINEGADPIIAKLKKKMSRLDKEAFEEQSYDKYDTYFYLCIFPALCLLLLGFFITNRKNSWLAKSDKDLDEREQQQKKVSYETEKVDNRF